MFSLAAVPFRRHAALGLLLGLLAWAAPASAIPLAVDGGWQVFQWTGAGAIDSPADGFQFTSAGSVEIQITDSALIGDEFEIFVNGVSVAFSSNTNPLELGFPSGAFTGPAAWADTRLSKVSLVLGPGSYDIDISATEVASGSLSGGFIQALSVPEPTALALLAVGFAGLLWVATPRPQPSARPSPAKK